MSKDEEITKLKEQLQVELRASNVLTHNEYPCTDYFEKEAGDK